MQAHDDFAFEASPGIPAPLPPGERVLWQGSPAWRALARGAFHVRAVALWFVALAALELLWAFGSGGTGTLVPNLVRTALLGGLAVAILATLAWLNARVTIYTVTDRRVLIRLGVALEVTLNLPFAEIDAASLRVGPNGVGDIPLAVAHTRGVGYLVLWPHARPWRFARPEPMLRAVPDAERVARLLGTAMREAAEERASDAAPRDASTSRGAVVEGPETPLVDVPVPTTHVAVMPDPTLAPLAGAARASRRAKASRRGAHGVASGASA